MSFNSNSTPVKPAAKRQVFYGWFIVVAGFITTATLGETFYAFGVFFTPLENEFGWSRMLTSSGFTAFIIGYAISVVTAGRLSDRYQPRHILLVSGILSGAGIALCSVVHDINTFRVFFLLVGLGAGATFSVPVSVVQRWFHKQRHARVALGVTIAGSGVGGIIFAPLVNHFVTTQGWRQAFISTGIIFFLTVFIAAMLMRPLPKDLKEGMLPKNTGSNLRLLSSDGWTTRKAITARSFISIVITACIGMFAFDMITVHLVPFSLDLGISAAAAAAALGLLSGFSVPGRLLSGFVSQRIGWQKLLGLSYLGMGLSVIAILFLRAEPALYVFVFVYGICLGIRTVSQVGIIGEFFGLRAVGELTGVTSGISQLVASFSPYIAGWIYDTTQSYNAAFSIVMVILFGAGVIALAIRKPVMTSNTGQN